MGLIEDAIASQNLKRQKRLQELTKAQRKESKRQKFGTFVGRNLVDGTAIVLLDGDSNPTSGFRLISSGNVVNGDRVAVRKTEGLWRADALNVREVAESVQELATFSEYKILAMSSDLRKTLDGIFITFSYGVLAVTDDFGSFRVNNQTKAISKQQINESLITADYSYPFAVPDIDATLNEIILGSALSVKPRFFVRIKNPVLATNTDSLSFALFIGLPPNIYDSFAGKTYSNTVSESSDLFITKAPIKFNLILDYFDLENVTIFMAFTSNTFTFIAVAQVGEKGLTSFEQKAFYESSVSFRFL